VMLFFPSVTFNILASEIFPWAILLRLVTRVRLKLTDVLILLMLTFWFLVGFFSYQSGVVVATMASYLNPLLAFILVLNCNDSYVNKINETLKFIFPIFCITAILQVLGMLTVFDVIFDFVIPRGGVIAIGEGRGVSIFSTEPSRAAVELLFMYGALTAMGYSFRGVKFGSLRSDLFIGLLILGVIKSATGLLFFFVLLAVRRPVLLWPIVICISLILSYLAVETRALALIFDVIESGSFTEALRYLVSQSGFRILSVVSSYIYGLYTFLGSGIGSWEYLAVDSYHLAGFIASDVSFFRYYYEGHFVALKPTAYGALVTLELGFISVVLFAFYLQSRLRLFSLGYKKHELGVMVIFLLYVFLIGAVGNPVPWVCAALVLRAAETRQC
jgi:hypothetical protein